MKTNKLFQPRSVAAALAALSALLTLLTAPCANAVSITNTFTTVGTNPWTCPVGVTSISVAVQGGGGAGGGSLTATNRIGAGGGGGGCAFDSALTVQPGTSYTVIVGAGGTAGATTTDPGNAGGNSSFSGGVITTLTANGGAGGAAGTGAGGAGGTATGGTVNYSGGNGVNGANGTPPIIAGAGGGGAGTSAAGSPGSGATGGAGGAGSPAGGKGGNSPTAQNNGNGGASPGGGGSGGCKGTTTSKVGGAGARGQVTIVYTEVPTFKADNTNDLNQASSWTVGVPTPGEVAYWNNIVTGPITNSLGADLAFGGINILDPGGPVTLNPGNTLTNGGAGIDMTAATQDLTILADYMPLTAAHNLKVAAGRTLTLSNVLANITTGNIFGPGTVRIVGTAGAIRQLTNSVTLVIDGGTVANNGSPLTTGPAAGDTVTTIITNGGSLNLNTASGNSINFGFQNTGTSVFTVSSGSVYVTNSGTTSGNALTLANVAGATAIMNLNGGTVTLAPKTLTDGVSGETALRIANNATATGILNLNGGTLNVPYVLGVGTCTVNFNGTTVVGNKDNTTWFSGPITANVQAGGAIFNSSGYSQTIPQALLHDPALGVTPDGGLTKYGSGTLTLTGAATYTGPTLVSAGKLVVPSTSLATGPVTNNAALGVTASGGSQWQPASLKLANPCALEFNSVQNPGTTNAPILPTAAVGAVANVTINVSSISGVVTPANSYPLLGNAGTTNGYVLGSQPLGVTGHLEISTLDSSTLVYVVDSSSDLWTGADFTNPTWWDIATTPNWDGKALLNPTPGTYVDGDGVLFDDSATPISPVTVDIQTNVVPGNMIFANSTKDYLITNSSGINSIDGSGSLTKTGSGTLTLASSNSYTGGTINSGANGIIAVNHANALGTGPYTLAGGRRLTVETGLEVTNAIVIGANSGNAGFGLLEPGATAGTATISGPIQINNSPSGGGHFAARTAGTVLDVKGVITASVPVTQRTGPGIVQFSGGGTGYTNLTVAENTVMVGAPNGIATSATVSIGNSGTATLDLNGFNQSLVGIAKGANSATITNSSATPVTLTLTGTSSYGGTIKDDGSNGKIGLTVAGGDLTLSGANTHSGDTFVNAGTLNVSNNLALQNSALITTGAGTLTLGAGITTPTIGGLSGASGDLATIISSGYGNVTDLTLNPISGTVTYGGVIADGAAGMTLTKSGAGTQVLNGACNITSNLVVSAGTMVLSGGGTMTGNAIVSAGTMQVGANNGISTSAGLEMDANGTTSAILDLNGFDQTLSRFVFTATNAAGNLTITGGANSTLTINTTNNTEIGPGGALTANRNVTNDMSGLGEFIWNGSANTFRVGVRSGASNPSGTPGVTAVTLADRNTITAVQLAIGTVGASSAGGTSFLRLGTTNVVNANTINIGTSGRSYSTLAFRTGLTSPKVTIRGTDGTAPVGSWEVGKASSFSTTYTATVDLSAGQLDALVTSLRIGMADTGSQTGRAGTENATFTMGKGTLGVTNLSIGLLLGSGTTDANFTGNGTFTLNDPDGIVIAENVFLGIKNNTYGSIVGTASANGTLNLGAGTIVAKSIDYGVQSGLGTTTQNFNFTNGTVRNYPGFDLAIANVSINLTGSGTRLFEATAGQSITVASSSVISGSGEGFTKQGAGTLVLSGANTYTGPTTISAGTLLVNGSLAAESDVTVNGGTLGGNGVINGLVTVNTGGTLSPGASPGILTLNSNLVLNPGSTNLFEVDTTAPTNDLVVLNAGVTYGGVLKIVPTGPFSAGQTFTLFSGLGATNVSNFASIQGSPGGSLAFSFTNGVLSVVSTGPVDPPVTLLTNSVSGGTLSLSWPANQGWRLLQQTNALSKGLGTNWFEAAGTNVSSTNIPLDKVTPATFYRLAYP